MPSLDDQLGAELDQLRAAGLYRQLRTIASAQGPRLVMEGREFLNFSSNDYLGLANDSVLKRAATEALEKYGVGAGASRHVSGNLAPYAELEERLARFKGKAAAVVFGSGYVANVATISVLVGKDDVVILDKLDHASIVDGARLSGATIRVYPHKNLKKLETILQQSSACRRRLIVTETVFSMDGDIAPLAEIVALKEKYDAWLMIDEAHATGLYGQHCRGLAEPLGLEDKIEVTVGTLSKALGCTGGFVAGSQTLIDWVRNRARGLIYSTALPPAMVAAGVAAVDFVMSDAGRQQRDQLWRNVSELKQGLANLGIHNESRSAIIPMVVGNEMTAVELSRELFERGIFVPAIRYPTVAKGKARLRVTVTAAHRMEDIEKFLAILGEVETSRLRDRLRPEPPEPVATMPDDSLRGRAVPLVREAAAGDCYFLTVRVASQRPVFQDAAVAAVVVDALRWLRDRGWVRLLGFVVMPDHVHVALVLQEGETLSRIVQSFKRHSCRQLELAGLEGAIVGPSRGQTRKRAAFKILWESSHHADRLCDKHDFPKKLQHLHENPSRKGLGTQASEYAFSTAHPDYEKEIDWAWYESLKP